MMFCDKLLWLVLPHLSGGIVAEMKSHCACQLVWVPLISLSSVSSMLVGFYAFSQWLLQFSFPYEFTWSWITWSGQSLNHPNKWTHAVLTHFQYELGQMSKPLKGSVLNLEMIWFWSGQLSPSFLSSRSSFRLCFFSIKEKQRIRLLLHIKQNCFFYSALFLCSS